MKKFKLYVTDLSKAYRVLTEAGYNCVPTSLYLEVNAEEKQKMAIVKAVNAAYIVMLDIE